MRGERLLLVGATSAIGRALGRELASRGAALALAGRDPEALEADARDLCLRHGAEVATRRFEARELAAHDGLVRECDAALEGGLTGLVAVQGVMEERERAASDPEAARRMVEVNLTSMMTLLEAAARLLEPRGAGLLAAIGSVAGDRGRASNYPYGATKAALATYLEGLRMRLAPCGVHVLTVKPGVVDTAMSRGRAPARIAASPERVARGIARRRRVVYTPPVWRFVMAGIRAAPEAVLQRLPL